MNKNKRVLLIFIMVFNLTSSYFMIEEAESLGSKIEDTTNRYGKGFRYNVQGWVYLHIEGEPYERGYQYGYLCSDEIVDMITRWGFYGLDVKISNLFKVKTPEKWWNLCKSVALKNSLKEYPEEYQEEMRGIADGVKDKGGTIYGYAVEFEDILTLNEMQGCWYSLKYLFKSFNPLKNIAYGIKNMFSQPSEDEGACSAFIATGDATVDGGIVAVHSTQPLFYLDERFNFVIEVQPTDGNRFIMAGAPPGFIWSLVNFYENEKGIILMESTLQQGPWKRKGIPIAVRSRKAIQYSNCIDDVLNTLLAGNNGLYECEWLIGDAKTGEIASIQLALYNTPVKRTYNGFYWSCNYPHDPAVKKEIEGGLSYLLSGIKTNTFYNSNDRRAEKFQEIEEVYYGKIDLENTKEIISTEPICENSCDAKITSSSLIKDMGLVLHRGNPNGEEWVPTSEEIQKFKGVTNLPAIGWVELYPPNGKVQDSSYKKEINQPSKSSKLLWTCKIDEESYKKTSLSSCEIVHDSIYVFTDTKNAFVLDKNTGEKKGIKSIGDIKTKKPQEENIITTSFSEKKLYGYSIKNNKKLWEFEANKKITGVSAIKDNIVCFGSWDGKVHSINALTGEKNWDFKTGWGIVTKPIITDDLVLFGSLDNNFYAIDKDSGELQWSFSCRSGIQSNPKTYGEYVFFGCDDGVFYALEKDTGKLGWKFKPKYSIEDNVVQNYLTTPINSEPVIDSGKVYISVEDTIYALDTQTTESSLEHSKKSTGFGDYAVSILVIILLGILSFVVIYIKKYKN
jgi:outer membrane protein assembly factor BamB